MALKRSKNWRCSTVLSKKETVESFFLKRGCQRLRTPYNAPPLTRNNGLQAAGLAGFRDERQQRKAKIIT
ncbi:hypothetical protein DN597_10545 [Enterobacter cloacae]|nr:hypothetical protein C3B80_21545 [Enterobacter cloacae]RWS70369.1 hypothetical protein DN597_10545 [Enterobacter cloacae]